jgi:hypothetical protein
VKGAIFYWSTTSAGIRRANIGDATPEDYITGKPGTVYDVEGRVRCVACHTVSRDGRKIAAPVDAATGKSLWLMDVTVAAPPDPYVNRIADTQGHGFATFSPDTSLVMNAWGGRLWLVDGNDGTFLGNVDLAGGQGTHPDWAPDDSAVVYSTRGGDSPGSAAVALLPVTGRGTFSAPENLVAQQGDRTNLFPMFSPDSLWVAFTRGRGGHGDNQMQLFLVDAKGPRPGTPIELVNANRVENNALTDGQYQNAAPTWAPPGDYYWVAFNSKRAYGVVAGRGRQQIWVAAIDPAQLASGAVDPSYPAFRLQFQGLNEDNHRAFWTLDVREEDPVDAGPRPDAGFPDDAGPDACVPPGNTCDPVLDCCAPGSICETLNDGVSYVCIPIGG